jgi:tRNA U34 5-carboxymethylaminomethyl modifying GTPase MnmE/TrmE
MIFRSNLPTKIEEHIFNKDVTVLVIGLKESGKKSLINAYNNAKKNDRFYFPSENINFIEINFKTLWSGKLNPDVIWFIINYQGATQDYDFNILETCFPQIPVIIVLNKVDQLQGYSGHTFDLVATSELPDYLKFSDHLKGVQQRYESLKNNKKFLLSQVMLTSMRSEEENDKPVGLLGLYQATLNCMDDKQFDRFDKIPVLQEDNSCSFSIKDFLETVKTIKTYKKASWRTVLICGSSNNGKTTLINTLFNQNFVVGLNGTPTTRTLQIFRDETSKVLYVDSAGLEKHDNTDKFIQLTSIRPDLIWLIVNYAASIEQIELDISTKYFRNTRLILIINKVDILQEMNIDQRDLKDFHKKVPDSLKNLKKLISVRKKLIKHKNMHRLVPMSLRQCEEGDKPIGLTNLVEVTRQHFNNNTSK